ncbi:MAG: prephenate dehydrogenase [Armatimonadota bacterium]|nr:prephenate dehydrogenase [Armatimonadota bacterium]MDR5702945.1 prephenate dehydrogenase [Armatimonadota bacterium]MDR7433864.1 prephenate dehydrogenase [Armatimonadota bacterium]
MERRPVVGTVAIVGVGLIGGSMGMALLRHGVAAEVVGVDRDPEVVSTAIRRGAVHHGGTELRLVGGADLVVVAVPVGAIPETVAALAPFMRADAIVTDVGSVKEPIVRAIEERFPSLRYVGGHPMAGSEGWGIEQADASLLDSRPFLLTRTERTKEDILEMVAAVVRGIGMKPVVLSPREHDALVARVSHLPYVVAVALVEAALRGDTLVAGPGFRDATRVAASPPAMWEEICRMNREELLEAIAEFERALERVRAGILGEAQLGEILRHAHKRRSEM